eukprot:TRINITY_DN9527_c0_g1_i1.p1 TRINITY_DN9527_c0_g1~~TRINITY_DN9527_c0_g1_i1.p1  ORF type:complete len:190 (-),score=16.43 TRINITY_DN9527_c0_g1_i1:130-699(-)
MLPNSKNELQEYCQRKWREHPTYEFAKSGLQFRSQVKLPNGEKFDTGDAIFPKKKEAEKEAARRALQILKQTSSTVNVTKPVPLEKPASQPHLSSPYFKEYCLKNNKSTPELFIDEDLKVISSYPFSVKVYRCVGFWEGLSVEGKCDHLSPQLAHEEVVGLLWERVRSANAIGNREIVFEDLGDLLHDE